MANKKETEINTPSMADAQAAGEMLLPAEKGFLDLLAGMFASHIMAKAAEKKVKDSASFQSSADCSKSITHKNKL